MEKEDLIPVYEFCTYYNIDSSFIGTLQNSGLVEISIVENKSFIPPGEISKLEKIIRLYYDLDVNLEGIETINHLLDKVNEMQIRINKLENRLRFYEDF